MRNNFFYPYVIVSLILAFHASLISSMEIAPAFVRNLRKRTFTIDTPAQTFTCTWLDCRDTFATQNLLAGHVKAHQECDGNIYRCTQKTCRKYFFRNRDLTHHLLLAHGILMQPPTNRANHPSLPCKQPKSINHLPDQPYALKKLRSLDLAIIKALMPAPTEKSNLLDPVLQKRFKYTHITPHQMRVNIRKSKPHPGPYDCPECCKKFQERTEYFEHLFQIHCYTFGLHTETCKQAHEDNAPVDI